MRINETTGRPVTWRDFAACSGLPTDWFYPDEVDDPDREPEPNVMPYRERMKMLRPGFQSCLVFSECRLASVAELGGMWAGVAERKRMAMRAKHYPEWDVDVLLDAAREALRLMDEGALWDEALETVGIADTPFLHEWNEGAPRKAGRKPATKQTEEVAA